MAYATVAQLKAYLGIKNSDTFTADAGTDILTLTDTAIDWTTGDQVYLTTTAADLPAPLAVSTIYYVIYSSPLAIQLATTEANADAGTEINITDAGTGTHTITRASTDDSLLTDLITRVGKAIDSYCGRTFTAASDTRYYEYDSVDGRYLHLDEDLVTITTLTNGDSSSTVIPNTEYWLWPRNQGPPYHAIRLEAESAYDWEVDTDYMISVAGTWGYAASGSEPADIVQACIEWAAYCYRKRDAPFLEAVGFEEGGTITIPQGMPVSVKIALAPYKRIV